MKKAFLTKIGYTTGIYGCTDEVFFVILEDGEKIRTFEFRGLYGAEYRVAEALKKAGFDIKKVSCTFGKMKQKDIKHIYDEYYVIKNLNDFLMI